MARIIILSARNWSFRDDETGQQLAGVSIEGTEAQSNQEADYHGMGSVKYRATTEAWEELKAVQLPCIADVDVGIRRGKGGAATASIERVIGTIPIELSPVKKAA